MVLNGTGGRGVDPAGVERARSATPGWEWVVLDRAHGTWVLSSSVWAEPFGLSLVEAMSCGTPVAAFATGAAAEIVSIRAGALATEETAEALTIAIHTARRCDRGQVRAQAESFDASTMIDRYEALMASMIDTPPESRLRRWKRPVTA